MRQIKRGTGCARSGHPVYMELHAGIKSRRGPVAALHRSPFHTHYVARMKPNSLSLETLCRCKALVGRPPAVCTDLSYRCLARQQTPAQSPGVDVRRRYHIIYMEFPYNVRRSVSETSNNDEKPRVRSLQPTVSDMSRPRDEDQQLYDLVVYAREPCLTLRSPIGFTPSILHACYPDELARFTVELLRL